MFDKLKIKIRRFLIWSQKYTQTDNIYLAKGGFWLFLERIVLMAASFLLAIIFANLIPPATYGNYKYILSLVGILSIFSLGGINTAITQATARGLEGSFYSGFKTKIKWGLLGSLVAMGGAVYYWIQGNNILPIPLLITAIFLPLMRGSRIYGDFLAGKKLFNIAAKYSMIGEIIFVGAMVITIFLTKNLVWLIAVYFIFYTFPNYFFYLSTKFKLRPNKKEDPRTISYGKHLSFIGILGRGAAELDKVLLFTLVGPIEVAVYSFAILMPNQIFSILTNINILALPKLVAKSQKEIKTGLIKKAWKLFILVLLIIGAYIATAPYIFKIFFPQYLDSVFYSQLFMLSLIAIPAGLLGTVFEAKMMKKQLYLFRIIGIVKLALLALLVPFFGILGVILALLGSRIFGGALTLFLFYFSFQKKNLEEK